MLFDLPNAYVVAMAVWLVALAAGLWLLLDFRRKCGQRNRRLVRRANVGLSVWMLLAALTVVEIYFAVVYDQSDSFNMTNVSQHWFARHVRPFQRILRFDDGQQTVYRDDREFPREKVEGRQHICFVGDSFTFGHGIRNNADRFSNLIGVSLEREEPGKFVVSNLADAGRDLRWTEGLIKSIVTNHLPVDTIVYVICLNDIETFNDDSMALYSEMSARAPSLFLLRDTYFLNLLYYRIQQARSARIGGYYSFLETAYSSVAWLKMQAKLDDLRLMCRKHGLDLRIVVFPFLHNLGPDYPFREAHREIVGFCHESGIPVLDLAPVLEPHVSEGLVVNRFDAHPNERAHALAAEAIEHDLLADLREKARSPAPSGQQGDHEDSAEAARAANANPANANPATANPATAAPGDAPSE